MSEYEVLCVGAVNVDTIALVSRLPDVDERTVAESFVTGQGGPAATAAVALARLGHSVAMCASVGADREGDLIIEGLEREGVAVDWIRRDADVPTARSIVLVDEQTRSRAIVTSAYRSRPRDIPLGTAPIVHVDQAGYGPASEALRAHRGRGPRLSIDGGNPLDSLDLGAAWLYAPTAAALRDRYGDDTQRAIARARADGAQIVVTTDGSRGATWTDAATSVSAAAYRVEVVSSLGAGDVFHGALLAGILDGRGPAAALEWANACAALSCLGLDGRSAIPTSSELDDFIRANRPGAVSIRPTDKETTP